MTAPVGSLALVLAAGALAACGGGSPEASAGSAPAGGVAAVRVSPAAATVGARRTQQFTAVVDGTNPDHRVTWRVSSPDVGADDLGSIDPSGLYTAPVLVPGRRVVVQAQSVADPASSGTAAVTVTRWISVVPATATVPYGGTVRFTAEVGGTADATVDWRASYASIAADGTYVAPPPRATAAATWDTVRASFPDAPWIGAEAQVTIVPPPPVLSSISGPAAVGEEIVLRGSGFAYESSASFPGADGRELLVPVTYVSEAELRVKVPKGSVSGPLAVELRVGDAPRPRSGALPFQRIPRPRLWPERRDVAAGESVAIAVAFLGGEAAPLAWSADLGAVDGGVYRAPAFVAGDRFARVTACVAGTASCGEVLLGIHPFRIEPSQPVVAAGQSVALSAVGPSGPIAAAWSVVEGNGALVANRYVAPARAADASRTRVRARVGSATQEVEIAVTGLAPGLVRRFREYVDLRDPTPRGAFADLLVVDGARAYVFTSDLVTLWGARDYYWIDVFDVADPWDPVWLGAVESFTHPTGAFTAGGYLWAHAFSDWTTGSESSVAVYDVSGALPVAHDHAAWDDRVTESWWGGATHDGRWIYVPEPDGDTLGIRVYDGAGGSTTPIGRNAIALPTGSSYTALLAAGGRLFVGVMRPGASHVPTTLVYAADGEALAYVGAVDGDMWPTQMIGSFLYGGWLILDASGPIPVPVRDNPVGRLVVGPGGRAAAPPYQLSALGIVDVSRPDAPERVGTTWISSAYQLAWAGTALLSVDGSGGLAAYDLSPPAGPLPGGGLAPGACGVLNPDDVAVHGAYAYVAGLDCCADVVGCTHYGELAIHDLSQSPPALVGAALRRLDRALSVQVGGTAAFVAHELELAAYDVSDPANPTSRAELPIAGARLALAGAMLYAVAEGRVAVIDVSVPSQPREVASVPLAGAPVRARIAGDLLLVSTGEDGLSLYDVSTPQAPALVSRVHAGGPVTDALRDGDVVWLAAGRAGLVGVDIHDRYRPAILSSRPVFGRFQPFWPLNPAPGALALTARDGVVWVGADGQGALLGFDVRDPSRPALASTGFTSYYDGNPVAAFAWTDTDLLVAGWGYVVRVDVARPRNVVRVASPPAALSPP